jgi:transcriptional regulator with XRE-family HTH domain
MTNAAQIQKAVELYNSGASGPKVAELLGTYPVNAYKILRENGVVMRHRGRPQADGSAPRRRIRKTIEEMVEMYKGGMTLEDIATALNSSRQYISKLFCDAGYYTRDLDRKFIPNDKQKAIVADYEAGVPPREIRSKYKVCDGTIKLLRDKLNVEAKDAGFYFRQDPEYQRRNKVVAERYKRGDRVEDIAAELGIYETAIPRILRRQGLEPSRMPTSGNWRKNIPPSPPKVKTVNTKTVPFNRDKKLIKRITTLRDASFTYDVIAAMVGVSRSTVNRIAQAN